MTWSTETRTLPGHRWCPNRLDDWGCVGGGGGQGCAGRGDWPEGSFQSTGNSGYQRLEKRLSSGCCRLQNGWRAVGGQLNARGTELTGTRKGGRGPPLPLKRVPGVRHAIQPKASIPAGAAA